jgi:AsmA protein
MKTLLKILGVSAAVLATLSIGAAIFLVWLFDPNDYKEYVADWVESRTGRDFVIEDDLTLTFFPSLGVETGSLRLGNAEGLGGDPFLTAERAVVRVKILPLFLARVELGNLEIDGLRLNLSRDLEQRGNWEDLLASSAPAEGSGGASAGGGGRLQNLSIEGVEIRDGLIFWRENDTDVRYILSELALETGAILIGQPVRTELSFELVSVEPQFTAQITASGTTLINPASSRYLAENLQVGFYVEDGRHEERLAGSLQTAISLSTDDRAITFSEAQLETSLKNAPLGPAELQFGATASAGMIDLVAGTIGVMDLTTNSNGVLASWDVAGSSILGDPELTGTVRIEDESLAAALDLLDIPRASTDTDNLGGFDLSAVFTVRTAGREVILSDLRASGLNGEISGALSANASGDASGHITIPEFDPRAVLDLLPASLLGSADYSDIDSLALAAEFETDGVRQQTSVRDIRAEIAGTSVSGAFDHFHVERRSEGSLSTSNIDPELVVQVFPGLLPPDLTPERLGTLRLSTDFAYDTVTDELQLEMIDADALGLQGTGAVTASELLTGSPKVTGAVRIERFDPQDLYRRFGQSPPVTNDTSALSRAVLDTRLDVTSERGYFHEIRLQLDDSAITGEFTVREFSDPEYDFSLAIDEIDIDRYLPPTASDEAAPAAGERPIELPTQALHDLTVDGRVTVGNLQLAGMDLSDVSTQLAIGNGVASINSARAKLYEGDFEGAVELDARGGVPQLTIGGTAVGVQLDPILVALRGSSDISGTGNIDLSLSGIGASLDDALATTSGRVDFALRDGDIRGFNFSQEMCEYWNTARRLPLPVPTDVDYTAYQLLRGSAVVTEGITRTSDLQATTSFMEVTGRGQLDLTTRDINYDLIAVLTESTGIAGCETMDRLIGDRIPVKVTGNVTAPQPSFDFPEAVREAIENELGEALRERLQELIAD